MDHYLRTQRKLRRQDNLIEAGLALFFVSIVVGMFILAFSC